MTLTGSDIEEIYDGFRTSTALRKALGCIPERMHAFLLYLDATMDDGGFWNCDITDDEMRKQCGSLGFRWILGATFDADVEDVRGLQVLKRLEIAMMVQAFVQTESDATIERALKVEYEIRKDGEGLDYVTTTTVSKGEVLGGGKGIPLTVAIGACRAIQGIQADRRERWHENWGAQYEGPNLEMF